MYVLIIESGAPPQLAAKYEGDHRQEPKHLSNPACDCFRSIRLDTPLRLLTSFETETLGG